jgi:REP element-mobilizing transposase RayT
MPEHVHLLVNEPGRALLSKAIQALKLSVAMRCRQRPFWQAHSYDFNLILVPEAVLILVTEAVPRSSQSYRDERVFKKLRYIHRNRPCAASSQIPKTSRGPASAITKAARA